MFYDFFQKISIGIINTNGERVKIRPNLVNFLLNKSITPTIQIAIKKTII